jgi:hypothetical protein
MVGRKEGSAARAAACEWMERAKPLGMVFVENMTGKRVGVFVEW